MKPSTLLTVGVAMIWAEVATGYLGLSSGTMLLLCVPLGILMAELTRRFPWMDQRQPLFPRRSDADE